MFSWMRTHLTYANVIATVALFMAFGGSAYAVQQINGKNIKNRSIVAKKIKRGSLGSTEVNEKSIASKLPQVALAGTASDAGKLGGIPLASVVTARSATDGDGNCDPNDTNFVTCVSVPLTLTHSGRVLLVGTGGVVIVSNPPVSATCRLAVDGVDVAGSAQSAGDDVASHFDGEDAGLATTAVTGDLAAGFHTFALSCRQDDPDATIHSAKISALLAGSS
jgi:hypothetical protein